jgi:hypothetical protein
MNILIDLDPATYRRLEKVAPAKSRRRSAFIRAAIQKALWELEEEATRRAYLEAPDPEPAPFDAAAWEPIPYGGFDPPAHETPRTAPAPRKRRNEARPRTRAAGK